MNQTSHPSINGLPKITPEKSSGSIYQISGVHANGMTYDPTPWKQKNTNQKVDTCVFMKFFWKTVANQTKGPYKPLALANYHPIDTPSNYLNIDQVPLTTIPNHPQR